jgi:thymidylate kinase
MARIIAITGIDGSGKTTSAKSLRSGLERAGYRATYKHQFDSVFARIVTTVRKLKLNKSAKDKLVGESANRPLLKSKLFWVLKKFSAYVFLLLQALGANRARFSKQDFLVFDRYFYDDFIRFRQRSQISERYFFFVEKLVPRPILVVQLSGDAKATYDRQVDFDTSFESYIEKLAIHCDTIEILKALGFRTISIDTINTAQSEVLSKIMTELKDNSII